MIEAMAKKGRADRRAKVGRLILGCGLLMAAMPAGAQTWDARALARGGVGSNDSGFSYCGSSDGGQNCAQTNLAASGSVTYANNATRVTAKGFAQGVSNPAGSASASITADLSTGTIRQASENGYGDPNGTTAGRLIDTLTFSLPDQTTIYAILFSASFDGTLSGDAANGYHPGLYATSTLYLGNGYVASTQAIDFGGNSYNPPNVSQADNGQWVNTVVSPGEFGYAVSGDVLIGGDWGNVLTFNMQSAVGCANSVGLANCDFSHTQAFDFGVLPPEVSYSSASGVFLTAMSAGAVPEAPTWLLMIAGFGMTGGVLRRRPRALAIT